MIAQVWKTGGTAPPAGDREAFRANAQKILEKQRAVDGCEGVYVLAQPGGGGGLAFTLWRDEASMKAAANQQAADIENARKDAESASGTMEISEPTVYEVIGSA